MEGSIDYNNNIVGRARSMGLTLDEQQATALRDKGLRRILPLEREYD